MASKILKINEFDLNYLKNSPGTYYVCKDTNRVYRDTDNKRERISVIFISTELNRVYNTRPVNGKLYYIWETNELWVFSSNKWEILIGNTRTSSGYYYTSNYSLEGTQDSTVIDNNGLLKDGSVVVRDDNRIIKGKLFIDKTNNNLVISSFLGGGIRLLPNGNVDSPGSLLINPNTTMYLIDKETGERLTEDTLNKYIEDQINIIIEKEIAEAEKSNNRPLTDSEKENIKEQVNNRPLLKQEIMQSKCETVLEQRLDGYALYNGDLNVTGEYYVQKYIPTDSEDYRKQKEVRYKVYHEGNLDIGKLQNRIEDLQKEVNNLRTVINSKKSNT